MSSLPVYRFEFINITGYDSNVQENIYNNHSLKLNGAFVYIRFLS